MLLFICILLYLKIGGDSFAQIVKSVHNLFHPVFYQHSSSKYNFFYLLHSFFVGLCKKYEMNRHTFSCEEKKLNRTK